MDFFTSFSSMKNNWQCPCCASLRIIEIENLLFCSGCQSKFSKKLVNMLNEEIQENENSEILNPILQ